MKTMNTPFLDVQKDSVTFKVLRAFPGTADAELSSDEIYCLLETKIVSGTIREEQIRSHLIHLYEHNQKIKKLVLLTPDDSGSQYVRQFTQLDPDPDIILHLEWKKVYNFFHGYAEGHEGLLSEIIRQYLEKIHNEIFEQDFVGVILTIAFNEVTRVNPDTYLDEMRNGEWPNWPTPQEYKKLDGTGRKLLLYDPKRQAITVEVEISKVEMTGQNGFPWSNKFAQETLKVDENLIVVQNIRKIKGFENFGVYRKGRKPIRNLTYEQYRQLKKRSDTVT
jgi:hypothetical protein